MKALRLPIFKEKVVTLMNGHGDENNSIKNGLNIDNEAFKQLAGNLLKSEKSLDSIMQMATSLLGNDALLHSIADRTAANPRAPRTVSKEDGGEADAVASVTENPTQEDILLELVSMSEKLEDIDKNVSDLKREMKLLRLKVSKRLRRK